MLPSPGGQLGGSYLPWWALSLLLGWSWCAALGLSGRLRASSAVRAQLTCSSRGCWGCSVCMQRSSWGRSEPTRLWVLLPPKSPGDGAGRAVHEQGKGVFVARGCAASSPTGRSEELPAWFSQCLKPAFTFSAMKHSHAFCFTSVIAYNSMKLQPELISLAADKGSCQVWQRVITQGDRKEGAASPRRAAPG